MLEFGHVLLAVSGLSFLGVGLQRPYIDWGSMVAEGTAVSGDGMVGNCFSRSDDSCDSSFRQYSLKLATSGSRSVPKWRDVCKSRIGKR